MARRILVVIGVALLITPVFSISSFGVATVKYTNQKAGQFCKTLDVGKTVQLPNGSTLRCMIAQGAKKPKWKVLAVTRITSTTDPTICVPKVLPTLPIGSNRISVIKMEWKRDASGYVSVELTLRNDNTVNLRVIQYQFFYWYGNQRRSTAYEYQSTNGTTTIEHFFSQDTEKLMGVDNVPGAWLAGQTRVFLVDTAKILDCSKVSVLEGDFNVLQGIGANS